MKRTGARQSLACAPHGAGDTLPHQLAQLNAVRPPARGPAQKVVPRSSRPYSQRQNGGAIGTRRSSGILMRACHWESHAHWHIPPPTADTINADTHDDGRSVTFAPAATAARSVSTPVIKGDSALLVCCFDHNKIAKVKARFRP